MLPETRSHVRVIEHAPNARRTAHPHPVLVIPGYPSLTMDSHTGAGTEQGPGQHRHHHTPARTLRMFFLRIEEEAGNRPRPVESAPISSVVLLSLCRHEVG